MTDELQNESQHSPMVTAISVVVVFLINISILIYAVSIGTSQHELAIPALTVAESSEMDNRKPEAIAVAPTATGTELTRVISDVELPNSTEVSHLYLHHCSACHGSDGRGQGPAAEFLFPKPRNFVESPFRFSSPGGSEDEIIAALERTISQGVPRSSMPGFLGVLSEGQIAGLARQVLSLRDMQSQPPVPDLALDLGRHPPINSDRIEHGASLYKSAGCIACHGESGHGDGPAASGLRDSTGRLVKPADFASGLFKSGQSAENLARTIVTGVPGTPMIAFEPLLVKKNPDGTPNADDVWDVVSFIQSLGPRPAAPGVVSGAEFFVVDAPSDEMFDDPAHVAWLGVESTLVSVAPLWQRSEHCTALHVRVIRGNGTIAFCLDWVDETVDLARTNMVNPDIASVSFALGDEIPPIPLQLGVESSDQTSTNSMNIWNWGADRQVYAITGKHHGGIAPGELDHDRWFLFEPGAKAKVPADISTSSEQTGVTRTGNADIGSGFENFPVLEGNTVGIGKTTYQSKSSQQTRSTAVWADGVWRVVFVRTLSTEDDQDVQFTSARRIPISFSIWNGGEFDDNGHQLTSGWHWLVVNP